MTSTHYQACFVMLKWIGKQKSGCCRYKYDIFRVQPVRQAREAMVTTPAPAWGPPSPGDGLRWPRAALQLQVSLRSAADPQLWPSTRPLQLYRQPRYMQAQLQAGWQLVSWLAHQQLPTIIWPPNQASTMQLRYCLKLYFNKSSGYPYFRGAILDSSILLKHSTTFHQSFQQGFSTQVGNNKAVLNREFLFI